MKPKPSQDIKRYIARLPEGEMFATRALIHCAVRNTLDQTLSRLCKAGAIIRIASGMYMKPTSRPTPMPTPQEVATAKARAWGKRIMESGLDAAFKLKLFERGESEHVFLSSGCTTSFKSIVGRIHFRKTAPKKLLLGDRKIATFAKALWYMGRRYCERTDTLKRLFEPVWQCAFEREELISLASIIPSWLRDKLQLERYFNALFWEKMKRTPIDRVTMTTQFLPGGLREEIA